MSSATAPIAECEVPQELLDRAMQLPTASREKFGKLLLESVAEATATRDLIHARIAQLVSGEAKLLDPEDMFTEMKRRVAEVRTP